MFTPNLKGKIARQLGFTKYGQPRHGDQLLCPFAFVNSEVGTEKTSVRADSSASRGAADEMVALRTRVLIVPYIKPGIGDRFIFESQRYLINAVHPRRSTMGGIDHYECVLELLNE